MATTNKVSVNIKIAGEIGEEKITLSSDRTERISDVKFGFRGIVITNTITTMRPGKLVSKRLPP